MSENNTLKNIVGDSATKEITMGLLDFVLQEIEKSNPGVRKSVLGSVQETSDFFGLDLSVKEI